MNQNHSAPSARPAAKISTEDAARLLLVQPQTMRAAYCRHGHYCGLKPIKLPSRRLLWPAAEVERLLSGEGAK